MNWRFSIGDRSVSFRSFIQCMTSIMIPNDLNIFDFSLIILPHISHVYECRGTSHASQNLNRPNKWCIISQHIHKQIFYPDRRPGQTVRGKPPKKKNDNMIHANKTTPFDDNTSFFAKRFRDLIIDLLFTSSMIHNSLMLIVYWCVTTNNTMSYFTY